MPHGAPSPISSKQVPATPMRGWLASRRLKAGALAAGIAVSAALAYAAFGDTGHRAIAIVNTGQDNTDASAFLTDHLLVETLVALEGPGVIQKDMQAKLDGLRDRVTVEHNGTSYWITARGRTPERAAQIVQAIAQSHEYRASAETDEASRRQMIRLDRGLSTLKRELALSRALATGSVPERPDRPARHSAQSSREGPTIIHFDRLPVIESRTPGIKAPLDLSQDAAMARLAEAYTQAEARHAELEATLPPGDPELALVARQKQELNRQIKRKVRELTGGASTNTMPLPQTSHHATASMTDTANLTAQLGELADLSAEAQSVQARMDVDLLPGQALRASRD